VPDSAYVLIDDRVPPFSSPDQPVWEPDWRLCGLVVAAVAAGAGSALTEGFIAFVLICACVAFAASALTRALPYGEGLREHRQ
jgi:hypothetical protein